VQILFIRRQGDSVWSSKVLADELQFAFVNRVNAAEAELLSRIIEEPWKAERRIGKEERAVGSIDKIVWTVQPVAIVAVCKHGLRPVSFVSHHSMIAVLIDRQASLRIERQSI